MLLDALARGDHGIRINLPPRLDPRSEEALNAGFVDHALGLEVWLLFEPGGWMDLSPAARPWLRARMERYTRQMFDDAARRIPREPGTTPEPRTDDPAWSPLVEVEDATFGGPALWTVHRMMYRAGTEVIMAHLLAPTRAGLFEVRLVARAAETGFRESVLMLAAERGQRPDPGAARAGLPQAEYDDPRHDPAFPTHPLSRLRAARRALLPLFQPEVAGEPDPWPEVVELPALGARIRPPPGFRVKAREPDDKLERICVCTTDGGDWLSVTRASVRGDLLAAAVAEVRADHVASGLPDGAPVGRRIELSGGRAGVFVRTDSEGRNGALRNASLWFPEADGAVVRMDLVGGIPAFPEDALLAELRAVAESFERVAPPGRPWWKVW